MVRQVSNGFEITQQSISAPFQQPTTSVFLDFPTMVAALSAIFGVPAITADSINATISAAATAATTAAATH
jgi:hypothetical protein